MHAVVADFEGGLSLLPGVERRLLAFLGSTIGNLPPDRRRAFLLDAATSLRAGAWFLLGFDLVKDPARLVRAYDDAARVTQEFNRNLLRVLNRELDADFVDSRFEHVARWDADNEWMEMALRSRDEQRVRVRELDLEVELAAGEEIRTEISAKFRPDGVAAELEGAGFAAERFWFDRRRDFGLCLAQRT